MNIAQILSALQSQRSRLDQAITALEGLRPKRGGPTKATSSSLKPRTMSRAARQRIAEAKRKWWAEKKASRKRPHITAAGRKRLSALMKARWAEKKKAKR
jgi:hypothetical protein